MRFQVPQFIEVEDKIFGPLTLKQFIYLAGAGGIVVILWALIPPFFAFLLSIPVGALGVALAFVKVNNRPFIAVVEAGFSYIISGRLYLWKKRDREIARKRVKEAEPGGTAPKVPAISHSKLKDLAWNLDVRESIYSNPDQQK